MQFEQAVDCLGPFSRESLELKKKAVEVVSREGTEEAIAVLVELFKSKYTRRTHPDELYDYALAWLALSELGLTQLKETVLNSQEADEVRLDALSAFAGVVNQKTFDTLEQVLSTQNHKLLSAGLQLLSAFTENKVNLSSFDLSKLEAELFALAYNQPVSRIIQAAAEQIFFALANAQTLAEVRLLFSNSKKYEVDFLRRVLDGLLRQEKLEVHQELAKIFNLPLPDLTWYKIIANRLRRSKCPLVPKIIKQGARLRVGTQVKMIFSNTLRQCFKAQAKARLLILN